MAERIDDTPKETHLKSGLCQQGALRWVFPTPLFFRILLPTPVVRTGQGAGRQSTEFSAVHTAWRGLSL